MKNILCLILLLNIKFLSAQENSFVFFDANNTSTLAINKDGTLWNICSKEKISNDNDWKSLSISGDNLDLSILIKNNGSLWGYGYRYFSGLYTGPDKFLYKIDDDNIWKKVIALEKFAIALKEDGTLWYWEYLPLDNLKRKVSPIKVGDLKIDDFNISSSFPPFLTVLSHGKLYGMMLGDGIKINIKDYSFTLLNETHKWKYVVTQNYSPTVLLIAEDNTIWYCKISYTNDINKIKNEIVKIKKISNENDWKIVSFYNNVILGIKNDGSVYIWSNGEFNGSPTFPSKMNLTNLPVQFFKNNKWSSAKVTENRIVLKDEQGFLFAYGNNTFGQLCDGGTYSFSKNLVKLLIAPEININKGEYEYTGIKEEVSYGVIYEQIKKGDKIGYCDENKQVVFEPLFDNTKGHINGWESGYKDIKKNGKQGIINKNGSIIIPFEYDYFWCSFENDKKYFIIGNKNLIQYILDKDNKIIYQTPAGISITNIFTADESTKYYQVYNKELSKYGVINSFGKQIIPFEYENISLVNKENKYLKSLFYVSERQENGVKNGYIGLDGKILLPTLYDDVFQIGQGQYKAKDRGNEIVFDNNFNCLKGCQFIPKMPIEKPQIAQEIEKQAEFAYPKEQERLAQIESDKAAEQERLKRQKLIDEKGADYVVDQNWSSEYGLMWGSYKRGTIYFADGTISYSKMIFVDDSYGFEGSTTLTGDKKILYLTFEDAAKDAYRLAKGLSRSNEGRYYPEETTYTSSSNSSYSNSSSNTNNSVLNKGNICDDYNNSSINSPAYKYDGDWRCDGYNCNIKHRDVRFDDGTFGKIHLTSSGYSIGWTYDYYKSEYYAIRALYFYEKCNKTTSIGKGKN